MDYGFTDLTDSKSIKSVIYGFWNGFGKILKSVSKSVNYGFFTDLEKFSKSVSFSNLSCNNIVKYNITY